MALVLADLVQENTSTTGTGTLTLTGAVSGYQTFAAVGNANTTYYRIKSGTNSEIGIGTYTSAGTTLSRDTVLYSTAGGTTKITVAGGATVACVYPAEKAVSQSSVYTPETFTGTFTDGIVMDYVSGLGRISVGTSDGLTFYNGGVGGTPLGSVTNGGDWSLARFLDVGNGTLISGSTNPLIAAAGSAADYVQMYIHNDQSGTSSSSDIAAYPDNGTDASGWIDMGITSSGYADTSYLITGANEGYIFMSAPSGAGKSGNLVYATDSTGSSNAHQWYVGGFNAAKNSWKMQLNSSGLSLANALSIANGGTGQTTQTAAFDALSPLTTKGDLVVSNGTNDIRLPVGTDTWVLTADSTQASGLKWAAGGGGSFTGGTLTSALVLAANSTSLTPLKLQTGSLNTTAVAGGIEYDGTAFYSSTLASSRGVIPSESFIVTTATRTLTNNTALQSLFAGTTGATNGALTVAAATTYYFEASLNLSAMSATSGNMGFSIVGAGTATFTSANFHTFGFDATTQTTASATGYGGIFSATQAVTGNIVLAATGTAVSVFIKGVFRINAGGTIIPSVQQTTASAAVVGVNSWFKCTPIGSNTVTTVGNWS